MRLHRNVAEAIVKGLQEIHYDEHLASYVVPRLLKSNKKWGSRDRSFIAESIYDITRHWRKYLCLAGVNELSQESLWQIFAIYLKEKDIELPAWEEFSFASSNDQPNCNAFVVQQSIPDWLDQLGRKQLGDVVWEKEIKALNEPAEVVLRINPLAIPKKISDTLTFIQSELNNQSVETEIVDQLPYAIQLRKRKSILHTKAFQNGWVEVQDANSQKVALFCNPQPDTLIIDACAGAGGKSLHLAALVNNEADIFALDVVPHKIKELNQRAKRAKANCIESGVVVEFPFSDFDSQADLVLVDAPCTGLGTMKRDPDKKWKLTSEFVQEIVGVQQEILQENAKLVRTGGVLVYATCSILPLENQDQIQLFLNSELGHQFSLKEEQTLFAHQTGYDGFYMAKMIRN